MSEDEAKNAADANKTNERAWRNKRYLDIFMSSGESFLGYFEEFLHALDSVEDER